MRTDGRRRRSRGQAITELALIAPVLLVLLVGAAQVGALLYSQVQVDTAAREAARTAAQAPNTSGAYSGGSSVAGGYSCSSSSDSNIVCVAARNASGLLDGTKFIIAVTPDCATFTCSAGTGVSGCSSSWVDDGGVKATVSFQAPVFVPLLDRFLADSGKSYRTVSATVTNRVTPCTMNQGN